LDRAVHKPRRKLEMLINYLDSKFRENGSLEFYRKVKTSCTLSIVDLYVRIENFKSYTAKSAVLLLNRIKEDIFSNTAESCSNFFFRNFSVNARKIGDKLSTFTFGSLTILLLFIVIFLQSNSTEQGNFGILTGTVAVSSQVVLTFSAYVLILLLEKAFISFRGVDTLGVRYSPIVTEFIREIVDEKAAILEKIIKAQQTPINRLRKAVRKVVVILRLLPKKEKKKAQHFSNPLFYKYMLLIFIWVVLNFLAFVIQPVFRYAHLNGLSQLSWSSFFCDSKNNPISKSTASVGVPICYNYNNMVFTKIFYTLNIIYLFFSIQQIRKGTLHRITPNADYAKTKNLLSYYLYYKPPILREVCTLIEYACIPTTLDLDDWLLCEDLREDMIKAKISHSTNEVKNTGILVQRSQRVLVSCTVLSALVGLLLIPLMLFSKFTSGDEKQEIKSASITLKLYAGESRFLSTLFETQMMLENRELDNSEKDLLTKLSTTSSISRKTMQVVSFTSYSDTFMDLEEGGKDILTKHMRESKAPFATILIEFKVTPRLQDRRQPGVQ
jgi:hypothetical protein